MKTYNKIDLHKPKEMELQEWKNIYSREWYKANRESVNKICNIYYYYKLYGKDNIKRYETFYNDDYPEMIKQMKIDILTGKLKKIKKNEPEMV